METIDRVADAVITLAKETQRNSDDIKQMRRDIDDMARAIERLAYEVQKTRDEDRTRTREISVAP